MRLLSFNVNGKEKYGLVAPEGIIDLQKFFPQYSDLRALIPHLNEINLQLLGEGKIDYTFAEIRFLPVIPNPKKIICAGMNYKKKEMRLMTRSLILPCLFVSRTPRLDILPA